MSEQLNTDMILVTPLPGRLRISLRPGEYIDKPMTDHMLIWHARKALEAATETAALEKRNAEDDNRDR